MDVTAWSQKDRGRRVSFRDAQTGSRRMGVVGSVNPDGFAWITSDDGVQVCLRANLCSPRYES